MVRGWCGHEGASQTIRSQPERKSDSVDLVGPNNEVARTEEVEVAALALKYTMPPSCLTDQKVADLCSVGRLYLDFVGLEKGNGRNRSNSN